MTASAAYDMPLRGVPGDAYGSTFGYMPNQSRPYTPMNALSRLIHRRKEELGLSWYEIADRGQFSSHTVVYALAKKPEHRQPPRAETLTRLARALEIDVATVRAAAANAAGYDGQSEPLTTLEAAEDVRVVVDAMNQLSAPDRAKLRRLAMSFLDDARTVLADGPQQPQDQQDEAAVHAELSQAADSVRTQEGGTVRSIAAKRQPSRKKKP